jgi:hypothetical protein
VGSGEQTQGEGFGEKLPNPIQHLPSLKRLEEAKAAIQAGDPVEVEKVVRALAAAEPGLDQAQSMLASVLAMQGKFNPSPDGDEGTAAHLFQLTIVLLVPTGITFLATADWRQPTHVAKRLVLPAVALVVAFSTLYYMEFVR